MRTPPLRRKIPCRKVPCRWYAIVVMGFTCLSTTVLLMARAGLDERDIGEGIRVTKGEHASGQRAIQVSDNDNSDAAFGKAYEPDRRPKQRVLAALDMVPHKFRLTQMQQDILSIPRPQDSSYNLNVTLSDHISLDREIEDTRPSPCRTMSYDIYMLPKASIVIPFYNEALSMLLRTVHSVLNRTPDRLLAEIILVDDASSHDNLKQPLENYIQLLPKVSILRNSGREGLIRSRMRGARKSQGEVIVFLDAHTEANVGWLEPMLDYLQRHPTAIVQPFVDGIDIVNLLYSSPSQIYRGGFSWDLRYVWVRLPQHTQDAVFAEGLPFWTPALIGCAIAVNKTYFNLIGAFDEGQTIWGGENLELSFRNWLCGGTVVTIPCSRVGHVFRPLPYREESDWQKAWQKNLMRVADVWLGDYRRYFYASTRVYDGRRVDYTPEERVSLQERIDLRDRLKCKPFKWYVNFVIPEIEIPPHDALYHGEITGYKSQACWEVLDDGYIGITYGCYEHKIIPENIFSLTKDGFLTHRDRCARFLYPKPILKLERCPSKPDLKFGIWSIEYRQQARWAQLKIEMDPGGGKNVWCTMQVTNAVEPHTRLQMPQASSCDVDNVFQFWAFSYRFDYRDEFIDKLQGR